MDENWLLYAALLITFVAVVALIEGVYLAWQAARESPSARMHRRLRLLSAGGQGGEAVAIVRRREFSAVGWLDRLLAQIPRAHSLDRLLEQSGSQMNVMRFIGLQMLLVVGLSLVLRGLTPANPWLAVLLGVLGGLALPYLYLIRKRRKRQERFNSQLPDAMDFMARSLRAGNPFSASIKAASEEMPEPVGTELAITFEELNYGLETQAALYNLGNRVGSEDVQYFVTAVMVQRQTGGNLADVLNKIARVMRERARTYGEIRIQATEMRMSARILMGLPFVVAGAISVFNPDYLPVLFTEPAGRVIIATMIALMLLGYYVVHRMISFRV